MNSCRGGLLVSRLLFNPYLSAQRLQKVWGFAPAFRLDLVAHFGKTNRKKVEKSMKRKGVFRPPDKYLTDEELQAVRPIEEVAASIDTTLTDEQKEYVAKLRKKMRGGDRSPRSLYREVPLPHEVEGDVGYMPLMAPNAEALIDYALSTIPKRAGPRRSRRKKRFLLKARLKKEFDDKKKEQRKQAHIRKVARIQRIQEEVRQVKEQAAAIRLKQQSLQRAEH